MDRRAFAAACLAAPVGVAMALVHEAPPEIVAELPGARLQGGGRLRVYGFHVYDIRLFSAERRVAADWALVPLALDIEYRRALEGQRIAERSLDEMRRQGEIGAAPASRWLGAIQALFPDVEPGDRFTGVQRPGEAARFYLNGRFRGEVRDAEFTRLFFGIWLSARSSEPALRDALLGSPP